MAVFLALVVLVSVVIFSLPGSWRKHDAYEKEVRTEREGMWTKIIRRAGRCLLQSQRKSLPRSGKEEGTIALGYNNSNSNKGKNEYPIQMHIYKHISHHTIIDELDRPAKSSFFESKPR